MPQWLKKLGLTWTQIKQKLESEGAKNKAYDSDVDGVLDVAAIPSLDASKITSGILDVARIPDLDASKIISGVLSLDRIPTLPYSKLNLADSILVGDIKSTEFNAANKLLKLDANALIPLTHIPTPLTGKDADTVDGYHGADLEKVANKGAASGYCELDANALVPTARIPSLPRSKISDFFNSPFWDNIPDKPSTFPPSSHTHPGSDITSQVADADKLDGKHATAFALVTSGSYTGDGTTNRAISHGLGVTPKLVFVWSGSSSYYYPYAVITDVGEVKDWEDLFRRFGVSAPDATNFYVSDRINASGVVFYWLAIGVL
ncbi:hypothetical protein DRO97_10215 [Archaeoglobales archaeon]|nr:MAG: hypothetical protein DRO97_10215 [Archaeoglobales archaeon]